MAISPPGRNPAIAALSLTALAAASREAKERWAMRRTKAIGRCLIFREYLPFSRQIMGWGRRGSFGAA
jgi:hypothetical protein